MLPNQPRVLPADFANTMKIQLGDTFGIFEIALNTPPPVSIRNNPFKVGLGCEGSVNDPVAWCEQGLYLPERPVFTLDPTFHAGAYYVQEASSMFVGEAFRQSVGTSKPVKVLDLCAAPGGKSTLLASMISSDSVLLANEVIRTRVGVLKENLQRWGAPNVGVSSHDPEDFGELHGFFDVVLVDAPCSGEGLFRKDADAINEWSADNVVMCAGRQKRILASVAPLLTKNGILIYSTCTYNNAENTENCDYAINVLGLQEQKLNIPAAWGIIEKTHGYQFYPHLLRGEGFFLAVFKATNGNPYVQNRSNRKLFFKSMRLVAPGQAIELRKWLDNPADFSFYSKPNLEIIAIPNAVNETMQTLDFALKNKGLGLEMGSFKGSDFIPSQALALSTAIKTNLPAVELDKATALQFLKKENILVDAPKGWLLARYDGLNLGWLKNLGNRTNNYLPKDWRIRMDIREF